MQKNIVIIPCSGTGKRMGNNMPKQFLKLDGKPIICHTIEKFEKCEKIDEIIIVISKDYE
ncbi:MAG: 2-C-methyl-D-erythritol 4-phosphate cytidylyltransferase, partial [Eubacteriales bacterium]|nr:2-C-methyl-D-erythritol 4-phosphate cytidylyltransferase [Eubacteriales bacterium]